MHLVTIKPIAEVLHWFFKKVGFGTGSGKYSLNFGKDNFFFASDIPFIGSFIELFEDYKDTKIYFSPQSFNTGISASRKESANLSQNRISCS